MGIFFNRKKKFELRYGSSKPIEIQALKIFCDIQFGYGTMQMKV